MDDRRLQLIKDITEMDMSPAAIERNLSFPIDDSWDTQSPWDKFMSGVNIHLGKRSSGWKFIWNFHKNQYYTNKEELLAFIRSGRVVDEYGEEWEVEVFIKMALDWGQPDGAIYNKEYEDRQFIKTGFRPSFIGSDFYNQEIDGLVISRNTEFS